MRVQLKQEGGLAYLPGLQKTMVLETGKLPEEQADQLRRLVQAARFFDLPDEVGAAHPGAADYYLYIITVEEGGRHHTVQTIDPIEDQALSDLVYFIQSVQQPH